MVSFLNKTLLVFAFLFTACAASAAPMTLLPGCHGTDLVTGERIVVDLVSSGPSQYSSATGRVVWIDSVDVTREISLTGTWWYTDWAVHMVGNLRSGEIGYRLRYAREFAGDEGGWLTGEDGTKLKFHCFN